MADAAKISCVPRPVLRENLASAEPNELLLQARTRSLFPLPDDPPPYPQSLCEGPMVWGRFLDSPNRTAPELLTKDGFGSRWASERAEEGHSCDMLWGFVTW